MGEFKPVRLWAVTYGPRGNFDVNSIRSMRRLAIEAFCGEEVAGPRWGYWRKKGCRVVRVRVVIEPQP